MKDDLETTQTINVEVISHKCSRCEKHSAFLVTCDFCEGERMCSQCFSLHRNEDVPPIRWHWWQFGRRERHGHRD